MVWFWPDQPDQFCRPCCVVVHTVGDKKVMFPSHGVLSKRKHVPFPLNKKWKQNGSLIQQQTVQRKISQAIAQTRCLLSPSKPKRVLFWSVSFGGDQSWLAVLDQSVIDSETCSQCRAATTEHARSWRAAAAVSQQSLEYHGSLKVSILVSRLTN